MTKTNKNKKQHGGWIYVLLVLGIMFYIAAVVIAVFGIMVLAKANLGTELVHFGHDFDYEDILEEIFDEKVSVSQAGIILIMFALVLTVLGTVLIIVYKHFAVKQSKKSEEVYFDDVLDEMKEVSDNENQPIVISQPEENVPKEHIFCAYCGMELEATDKRCPNCGATKKIKKKVE